MTSVKNIKNTPAPSAANLEEAERNITPGMKRTVTPSQNANTYSAAQQAGDMQHMLAMMQNNTPTVTQPVTVGGSGDLQHMLQAMQNEQAAPAPAPAPVAPSNAPAVTAPVVTPAVTQPATTTADASVSKSTPVVSITKPAVNSYQQYIDDLYEAERKAALSALEAEYAAAIEEINRQQSAIAPVYQNARNQTAGVNARERQAMNEMFTAAGLSSGGRAQGNLAQSNTLQGELSALELAEAQALADVESQRTQIKARYQAEVREAIMNNELDKALAKYNEAIRYDNAIVDAAREQAEIRAKLGDFSGYAALGWSQDVIDSLNEAAKPKYTGSTGGSYVAPKEPETKLSLSDAKKMAENRYFSDEVLNVLHANGWSDEALQRVYGYNPPAAPTTPPAGGDMADFNHMLAQMYENSSINVAQPTPQTQTRTAEYNDFVNDLNEIVRAGDSADNIRNFIATGQAQGVINAQEASRLRNTFIGGI